jgi:hypothetical protein
MTSITATDLNDAFALFGLNDDEIYSAIATAGPQQIDPPPALTMQSTGLSEEFKSSPGKGTAVSDMLIKALADAMLQHVRGPAGTIQRGAGQSETRDSQQ